MRKSRKILVAVIVLVVVLAAVGRVAFKKRGGKKAETVQIAKAELGELVEFVSAPGEIEPRKKVEISAKVSARIIELPVEEGDEVTCGDPEAEPAVAASLLVQLDAKDLESQLVSAEASRSALMAQVEVDKAAIASQRASLEGLGASLEEAERDSTRKQGLLESQDISQSMYDQAKYRTDELKARFTAAEHTLKSAELNIVVLEYNLEGADARIAQAKEMLSHTVISSPIDGVVTRINAEVGEMVMTGTMNNPGTVIIEVADLSQMLVVAQVDEADIGGLEVGQRAKVDVQAFSGIEFEGTVDTIALMHNWSENRTKYFRTEILLDNDPNVRKLYSGLTADVDIQTRKHPDVIKIPSQAVLAREVDSLPLEIRDNCVELDKNKTHATVVYCYNDGKAVVTPVKIGPSDLTHTIITAGVSEEDRIVIGPYKVLDGLKHDRDLKDEREVKSEADEDGEKTDANKPKK
ncbi:MAG: efflux RND transporter periplasmic adaptor subunit [Planctomycetota bacterium]